MSVVDPEVRPAYETPDWQRWAIALVLAAVVSYFTAEARTEVAGARLEEREQNHYAELKRAIDDLHQDIRDMRVPLRAGPQ